MDITPIEEYFQLPHYKCKCGNETFEQYQQDQAKIHELEESPLNEGQKPLT